MSNNFHDSLAETAPLWWNVRSVYLKKGRGDNASSTVEGGALSLIQYIQIKVLDSFNSDLDNYF